jgi:uncharacterized protein YacL (UPF0231 family)
MADERDWKHFAKMSNEAQKPALQQTDVSGSFKHSILDTWKFSEWVAYNYVRLHEVWVHKYADQRNKDNWKDTGELWKLWWENFRITNV